MTNKEKAEKIGKIYAKQYHHNYYEGGLKNDEFCYSDKECIESAFQMAEWKDNVFNGFLFELGLKITEPKTSLDNAIAWSFPMTGLNAAEEVVFQLQNDWYEYKTNGTILDEVDKKHKQQKKISDDNTYAKNTTPILYGLVPQDKREKLLSKFEKLCNEYGLDAEFHTPDYILAEYILNSLILFGNVVNKNIEKGFLKPSL